MSISDIKRPIEMGAFSKGMHELFDDVLMYQLIGSHDGGDWSIKIDCRKIRQ